MPFSFRPLCLAVLFASAAAAHAQALDYDHQESWKAVHGASQSPIDIATQSARAGDARETQRIEFRHLNAELKPVDNGHAVEVETEGPEAIIRGRHFQLAQFHFHAESEHTLDGKHTPLEGHFVFKAADGRLAVVAVMYREGAANPLAGKILAAVDKDHPNPQALRAASIAPLLPRNTAYYHYLGSLTTPPLSENVEWYVLRQPITLSAAQLDLFKAHYSHNNRAVQPLNERPLIAYPAPQAVRAAAH